MTPFENFRSLPQAKDYLKKGITGGRASTDPVTEKDLQTALENLGRMDYVALTESIDDDLRAIARRLGFDGEDESAPKENVATNKYGLDPRNDEQMAALMPLIEYDLRLYQAAKASRQVSMA